MDDPQRKDHPILLDHVVHDPVVAHAESVERVSRSLDRLHRLPPYPTLFRDVTVQLLERSPDPDLDVAGQLLEGANRGGGQLDLVGSQASSRRFVVRPFT